MLLSQSVELFPGRSVGPDSAILIVAEAGINHDGDTQKALELIDAAKRSGADCVKFQTFKSESVVSASAAKAPYQRRVGRKGESQLEMVKRLELSREGFDQIAARCREIGIHFMSTPFDGESVEVLIELGVAALKVGSGDPTNHRLLDQIAETDRPVVLSTGMADLAEVEAAVDVLCRRTNRGLVLLHCVSAYPARAAEANLRAMDTLRQAFGVPVGFSDHTLGIEIALAAAARGADMIEKHLTLDSKSKHGPDHAASLDPSVFKELAMGVRNVESAIGDGRKKPQPSELLIRDVARRSLFAARDISRGHRLTPDDLEALRPGIGISPTEADRLVGCVARVSIPKGTQLEFGQFK